MNKSFNDTLTIATIAVLLITFTITFIQNL